VTVEDARATVAAPLLASYKRRMPRVGTVADIWHPLWAVRDGAAVGDPVTFD
jgi:hypothetical protein